jgi:Tfp pilus assembly protein PilN
MTHPAAEVSSPPVVEAAAPTRVDWAEVPRVNLLPAEILESRRFRSVQRYLALAVLAVVAALGGAVWWVQTEVDAAAAALAEVQAETAALQTEQRKYDAVPAVLAQVEAAHVAREQAMATDVLWYRYLSDLASATSSRVWLTRLRAEVLPDATATTSSSGVPELVAPLGIGALEVEGGAHAYPDVAGWIDALNEISGLSGSWLSTAVREQGDAESPTSDQPVTFTTVVTVTDDALSHRYEREGR